MNQLSLELLEVGKNILSISACAAFCIIFILICDFIGQIIGFLIKKIY